MNIPRLFLAALLAAIVSFFWGFVSWTMIGWHTPRTFADQAAVAAMIKANAPAYGIYMLPNSDAPMSDEAAMKAVDEENRRGPYVWAVVRPGPGDVNMGRSMALSFGRSLLAALFVGILISKLAPTSFAGRVAVCVLVAVVVWLNGEVPRWIWFQSPANDSLIMAADHLIEGLLTGLVLAALIRPSAAKS